MSYPYLWHWRNTATRTFDRERKGEACRVVCIPDSGFTQKREHEMTHPITACEWRVGDPGLTELRIVERAQMDGTVLYAVTRGGWVANRDHEWEHEVIPSSRDADFIARTRWAEWEDAARVAQRMVGVR